VVEAEIDMSAEDDNTPESSSFWRLDVDSKEARSGKLVLLWGRRNARALPAQNGPIVGSWYTDEADFFDSEFRIVHVIAWAPIPEHKPEVNQ
jgi:hypothetical protein